MYNISTGSPDFFFSGGGGKVLEPLALLFSLPLLELSNIALDKIKYYVFSINILISTNTIIIMYI